MKKWKEKKAAVDKPLFKAMLSGLLVAFAFTAVVFIAYALLLTYTEMSEAKIPLVVMITTVVAVCMAGFDTSKAVKEKGWLWGMVEGLIYIFILYMIGVFFTRNISFGTNMLVMALIALAGGGIGGILGINARKK